MRAIAVVAVAYLIAAKFGLKLALVNQYATAVWPPTGIALAAFLLWGNRLWPGVLIGAIVANVTTGDTITTSGTLASVGIATGNTLEALLGAYLVRRYANGPHVFERARNVLRFTALAALTSTMVSATVGVTCVCLAGFARWTEAAAIWSTWWIGDAGGDLICAPVLILWAMHWRLKWDRSRTLEAALLLFLLCALAVAAFTNVFTPSKPVDLGLAFLCVPALLWAAFRFGQPESALSLLLVSGIAIWGWLHSAASGVPAPAYELLELQAYLGLTSVAILAVGAEVSQRKRHEQSLDAQAESLRRQAQLLDLCPVLVRNLDDRIESWNSGAERLYGFKRTEAEGQISHRLLQTRFPEPSEQCRAKLFAKGFWQGELEHQTNDGRRLVVASLWVVYRDKKGQPEAILEVNNDITELRRAEDARLLLAAIVESSEDAIIAQRLDGVIFSWNSGAERIYGYTPAEAIGSSVSMLAPPGHGEEMPSILEHLRRGEKVDHFETKRRRKDGTVIDVAVTVSPIKSHTGELTAASVVSRDITDRKRLEEKLRTAQKLESIVVLAGGVAHDFNNLLITILGNASLALEYLPDAHPAHHNLQGIVSGSQAAAALVRQLLVYAGKGEFIIEPVDLSEVVRKMTKLLRALVPKRVDLRLELASNVPQMAGDPSQIQQVLMNLIINAAEAIGENEGLILVSVKQREIEHFDGFGDFRGEQAASSRYMVLEVQDTGCGMDDDTKSRVFDPFFTTKFTGRGLGLAAVFGIVRRHKGSINVHSVPGRGTTFEIVFPIKG